MITLEEVEEAMAKLNAEHYKCIWVHHEYEL